MSQINCSRRCALSSFFSFFGVPQRSQFYTRHSQPCFKGEVQIKNYFVDLNIRCLVVIDIACPKRDVEISFPPSWKGLELNSASDVTTDVSHQRFPPGLVSHCDQVTFAKMVSKWTEETKLCLTACGV